MTLQSQLRFELSPSVQSRGERYFQQGRVRLVQTGANQVTAVVRGSSAYSVRLSLKRATLLVSCTCPYFDGYGECKHIWATMLAADRVGVLQGDFEIVEPVLSDDAGADVDDPEEFDDYDEPDDSPSRRGKRIRTPRNDWRRDLKLVQQTATPVPRTRVDAREICYLFSRDDMLSGAGLSVRVGYRTKKKDGTWSKVQYATLTSSEASSMNDPDDRRIVTLLVGTRHSSYSYHSSYQSASSRFTVSDDVRELLMSMMCGTGRCLQRDNDQDEAVPTSLTWDAGPAWQFRVKMAADAAGKQYEVTGELARDGECVPLADAWLLVPGIVFWKGKAARLEETPFGWVKLLRDRGALRVPYKQGEVFRNEALAAPVVPHFTLPSELAFEEVRLAPQPRLKMSKSKLNWSRHERLAGELTFAYGDCIIAATAPGVGIIRDSTRYVRDRVAETAAGRRLAEVGFRQADSYRTDSELELTPRNLPGVVRTLTAEGWHVEADGKLFRQAGNFQIEVRSGIDWFELHGKVNFGDAEVKLPALLEAARRGENTVRLDDGTFGILPEDWLKKYAPLAGMGAETEGAIRYTRAQVGLLDALLASQPEVTLDEVFTRARDELRSFAGVQPANPPKSFTGELRGYQREGLGWLHFLERFRFGGCLADDMGLGKTVQVLALLEARRREKPDAAPRPSLVVVPRSLVFNWQQEAVRFTPELRVLDHTGTGRSREAAPLADADIILTTYGTLRRDILLLKDVEFDYCILDEAQAIKNAASESAKAVRLLRGRQRLALSGTPVENHLGELWSLFEFLNPGMLGAASALKLGGGLRNPDADARQLLAKALRPFLLRRTKEQVAKDLPAKSEQTLYCDLEAEQRKQYDELRDHYRQALLKSGNISKSRFKIQVLEALLRLRQVACHPGLVARKLADEPSAKLDVLLPQLQEVVEEGHKALVFSQFTSFLAIVRKRLDAEGIVYEYLDGRTRDRQARVERFQNDPECKLFLISLKAGGLGLNLTAAEYVFLLDPWWNPAVEAQAIDRTHRIGQSKPVFAYRLIARDTVEEKVLELQQKKRDLADAILREDNALIRDLTREDLELLLS